MEQGEQIRKMEDPRESKINQWMSKSVLHREPRESRSPDKLEALALLAVPNPGEAARENLPPCHSVRIKLKAREFEEARHASKKEYEKKFR